MTDDECATPPVSGASFLCDGRSPSAHARKFLRFLLQREDHLNSAATRVLHHIPWLFARCLEKAPSTQRSSCATRGLCPKTAGCGRGTCYIKGSCINMSAR
ncbi:hypothetical protein PF003_g36008 [Phytophthora fragariae]|nr:hypothetical protein PF003_g36008 [Phytophthora fragariae]